MPPGERIEQPTPGFSAPTAAPPQTTDRDHATEPTLDAVQARLATAVAQRAAEAPAVVPTEMPAPPSVSEAQVATINPALTRPTSLGIVGGGGGVLYRAPGSGIVRNLPAGSTLTVTGRSADGEWYAAYLDDGTAGWVRTVTVNVYGDREKLEVVSESVSPAIVATLIAEASEPLPPIATPRPTGGDTDLPATGTPAPSPEGATTEGDAMPTPAAAVPQALVTVEGANVRAGPGTDYPIVDTRVQNDRVTLRARNPAADWVQIELASGSGWIYAPLLQPDVPIESLPVSDEVRDEPGATAPLAQATQAQAAPIAGLAGQLVFQERNGGTIYRYDLGSGTRQPLTTGTDPAISPDGSTVAFVRGGGEAGLYLIGSDGANERRIFVANDPRTPAWSPEGQFVVFSQITGQRQCYDVGFVCLDTPPPPQFEARLVTRFQRNLARVDVNGGSYRDVPSLNSAIAPDWHAWGIVYQSDAGPQITQDQPDGETRPLLNEFRFQDPDWQPGDGRIVFQSQEGTHWEIFIANADGSGLAALTRPPSGSEQPNNVAPAWSPDGRWIVFASNRGGSWELWVMDGSGGNLRQLPVDVALDYAFQAEQMVDWGP